MAKAVKRRYFLFYFLIGGILISSFFIYYHMYEFLEWSNDIDNSIKISFIVQDILNNSDQKQWIPPTKTISDEVVLTRALRPLFFTVVNNGFLNITKNWMLNLEEYGIYDYLVLCIGYQCYDTLSHFGNRSNHVRLMDITQHTNDSRINEYTRFASFEYWTFIWIRGKLIQRIYIELFNEFVNNEKHIYNAIFFMDADTVIYGEFVWLLQEKYLWYKEEENIMYDVVLSIDCKDYECTIEKAGSGGYCMCLIFIPFSLNNHERVDTLLDNWMNRLDNKFAHLMKNGNKFNVNDQRELNFVLQETKDINIGVFDSREFPSGWLINNNKFKYFFIRGRERRSVKIIHANYITGHDAYAEKVKLFRTFDRWLVD